MTPQTSQRAGVARPLFAFAVAAMAFLLLPSQLQGDVGTVHGFTWQEAFDLLTPIAVIPPLWLAFERAAVMKQRVRLVVLAIAAIWIAAQGLHLGTNAIGDLFDPGAPRQAFYATPPGALDLWFDEVLSHWLWHIAWTGLLLALVVLVKRSPIRPVVRDPGADVLAAAGGVIHGVTWVAVTIEGSTTFLGIPAAAVLGLLGWRVLRQSAEARAVGAFLVASAVIALVLYAIYVAMYGWPPPELTETILKG